jgi:hypothetical protein
MVDVYGPDMDKLDQSDGDETHTHTHLYIHAYIHTYIHTCIHACMHTYI